MKHVPARANAYALIYLLWISGKFTLRQIGEALDMSGSAVSYGRDRGRAIIEGKPELKNMMQELMRDG